MNVLPIILASSSPSRKTLLAQIKIFPDKIIAPNIDETPLKKEKAQTLALRLACAKASKVSSDIEEGIIIAADTVCQVRGKILDKALTDADVKNCLENLSGRRHTVYTGLCIIKKENSDIKIFKRIVKSTVKFKRLTKEDIKFYCELKEGINKAGGCAITGYAQSFITFLSGSNSSVAGLPLYETVNILNSLKVLPKA